MPICSTCRGTKKIEGAGFMKYTCDDCNGTGRETETSKIQQEIDDLKAKKEKKEKAVTKGKEALLALAN